jgi:hypothetical protein
MFRVLVSISGYGTNEGMTPEQIVGQFQQILTTMQRIVTASADTAERVDSLEVNSGEILGKLTELQGVLELLDARLKALEEKQAG